jgi:uncharacterized protein YbjT (DUF2867 family)
VLGVIVVTAAGGLTGTAVVRELRARRLPVRAVVSRRRPRPELIGLGAEVVVAELTRPPAWRGVLDGGGLPSWRVLQPCAYADNLDGQVHDLQDGGALRSPWGLRTGQSLVDVRDVAAAGPESLTAPRLAGLIGERLGRPVVAEDAVPRGEVPTSYADHPTDLPLRDAA